MTKEIERPLTEYEKEEKRLGKISYYTKICIVAYLGACLVATGLGLAYLINKII